MYIYNKTSIERNILTIKKIHREVGRAEDLSASLYLYYMLRPIYLAIIRLSHKTCKKNMITR